MMRAGIVLAIAEDDHRLAPAGPIRQFFRRRVVNGVIERRSALAVFILRPHLVEVSRFVLVALEFVQDFAARGAEVRYQTDMVSKAHQECAVGGLENILQECLQIVVMRLDEMLLAAAGVHDQAQRQRKIGAAGKERNVLRARHPRRLRNRFGQVRGRQAGFISHAECDIDQMHVHLDMRRLLRHAYHGHRMIHRYAAMLVKRTTRNKENRMHPLDESVTEPRP